MEFEKRISSAILASLIALLFSIAFLFPLFPRLLAFPICGFRFLTGLPCPGCGLIHSFAALTHLRWNESLEQNPMGFIIAAWLASFFLRSIVLVLSGRELPKLLGQKGRDLILFAFLAALMIQWIEELIVK